MNNRVEKGAPGKSEAILVVFAELVLTGYG
jgi:hypothetical protein